MKKALLTNIIIYFVVLIALYLFDSSLELGDFSGLVFYLWALYFSIAYILFNLITFFIYRKKDKTTANSFILAGLISLVVSVILLIVSNIINN